jgi:hypothetical protein
VQDAYNFVKKAATALTESEKQAIRAGRVEFTRDMHFQSFTPKAAPPAKWLNQRRKG